MDLLVVRHAVAEERARFGGTGRPDAERPLTPSGRRKFRRGAHGLLRLVPSIDLLATSGLARALETAEILRDAYRLDEPVRLRELELDADPAALVRWLRGQRRRRVVAVVGHEPHLSTLVAHLLTASSQSFVDLKKGGACLLALGEQPRAGHAELRWLATARLLRRLDR
jgi:phosphohistidine phosphatase